MQVDHVLFSDTVFPIAIEKLKLQNFLSCFPEFDKTGADSFRSKPFNYTNNAY